jgi:hypothetical protein
MFGTQKNKDSIMLSLNYFMLCIASGIRLQFLVALYNTPPHANKTYD